MGDAMILLEIISLSCNHPLFMHNHSCYSLALHKSRPVDGDFPRQLRNNLAHFFNSQVIIDQHPLYSAELPELAVVQKWSRRRVLLGERVV